MILHDGAGDGYFVDPTTDPARVYYSMLEDPDPTYYGTVTEFINYIQDGFATEAFKIDDEGYLEIDDNLYAKLEEKHFPNR